MPIIEYEGGRYEAEQQPDGNWKLLKPVYQGPKSLLEASRGLEAENGKPQSSSGSIGRDLLREGPGMALGAVGGALGSAAGPLGTVGGFGLGYATGRQLSDVLLGETSDSLGTEARKNFGINGRFQEGATMEMGGQAGTNLLGRGLGWLGRQKQSFLRDVVAPSQDATVKAAEQTASKVGIKLTPGQRGSAFGAQFEAQRMNAPGGQPYVEQVKGQQQTVDKSINKLFPKVQPHKIGEAAQKKLGEYATKQEEVFEKAYDEAVKHIDVSPKVRMEARQAVLKTFDDVLTRNGLSVTPTTGGKYKVTVSQGSKWGDAGTTIVDVDPKVINAIGKLRQSAELTSRTPPTYQQVNKIRRNIGKEIGKLRAEGVDEDSLAVFDQLYGSLKDTQRIYLKPEGRVSLDQADKVFKGEKAARDKLGKISEMNPQNIMNLFTNRNADELLFLQKRLGEAGAPQVFETARKRYLRQVLDKTKSVDSFNAELDKLGSGVRERLFSDAQVKSAEDLARLRQFVEIPENARFRPGQGNFRFQGDWKEIPLYWYANKKLGPVYDQASTQGAIEALNRPYQPGPVETTLKNPFEALRERLF
jgi:hypothetical protein